MPNYGGKLYNKKPLCKKEAFYFLMKMHILPSIKKSKSTNFRSRYIYKKVNRKENGKHAHEKISIWNLRSHSSWLQCFCSTLQRIYLQRTLRLLRQNVLLSLHFRYGCRNRRHTDSLCSTSELRYHQARIIFCHH